MNPVGSEVSIAGSSLRDGVWIYSGIPAGKPTFVAFWSKRAKTPQPSFEEAAQRDRFLTVFQASAIVQKPTGPS